MSPNTRRGAPLPHARFTIPADTLDNADRCIAACIRKSHQIVREIACAPFLLTLTAEVQMRYSSDPIDWSILHKLHRVAQQVLYPLFSFWVMLSANVRLAHNLLIS